MHGTAELRTPAAAPPPGAPDAPPGAEPVFIQGMFAWLHRPAPHWGGDTAVLICPAFGRDAMDSHRFLRVLADDFAVAGYPTLRFDYPATGDSCELADMPSAGGNFWTACQTGVQAAADALVAATGARRLILCGLRIGATLSVLAAQNRGDVDGLILLAPVTRGQSYIRQLWVEAGLQQGETRKLHEGFALQDLDFNAEAVQMIAGVDLRNVDMPAGRKILVCAQVQSSPLTACESRWKRQGAALANTGFDGLEPLLSHELEGEAAPADFRRVLLWAKQNLPSAPAFLPAMVPPGPAALLREYGSETPIAFGPLNSLFGMLCQPADGDREIAVIICGGGRNPHYGTGRSAVWLARDLAQQGIASFRIDFAGLGDSRGPPGRETRMTRIFESRGADLVAAIDRLQSQGFRRFAVQGLCSGAYHAFHAALSEPRIGMLLLVNMPSFSETDAAGLELAGRASRSWLSYLPPLAELKTWRRLLNGKHRLGEILQGRLLHLAGRARKLPFLRWRSAKPAPGFARLALQNLSKRGVKIQFLFGPDEIGIQSIVENMGPAGLELHGLPGIGLQIFEKFDHSMGLPFTQQLASAAMIAQLSAWRSVCNPDPS